MATWNVAWKRPESKAGQEMLRRLETLVDRLGYEAIRLSEDARSTPSLTRATCRRSRSTAFRASGAQAIG